jgi:hypothetical protein
MPLGQRLAHVAPEGRSGVLDSRFELVVGASESPSEVEAGKAVAPAAFAGVGNAAEDAGEGEQRVSPAADGLGSRLELTERNVVQGGDGLVEMLVACAHRSTPRSSLRFAGETSAPARSANDPAKVIGEPRPRVERRFLHAVGEGEGDGDGEGPENPLASR